VEITITTPALLLPDISLLLLAYTNRFLAIATLVRNLSDSFHEEESPKNIKGQIENLQKRLALIRNMQLLGIFSFFLCVLSMFLLFSDNATWGSYIFGASLISLLASLILSLYEIQISTKALYLHLGSLTYKKK
jgi:uncharacterized membrane protein